MITAAGKDGHCTRQHPAWWASLQQLMLFHLEHPIACSGMGEEGWLLPSFLSYFLFSASWASKAWQSDTSLAKSSAAWIRRQPSEPQHLFFTAVIISCHSHAKISHSAHGVWAWKVHIQASHQTGRMRSRLKKRNSTLIQVGNGCDILEVPLISWESWLSFPSWQQLQRMQS